MSTTSIGRGPAHGGNENHEANPLHTTLGEEVKQEPPAGNDIDQDAPQAPPGPPQEPPPNPGRM